MSKRSLRDKQYELTPAENALLERVANDQDTTSLELPIGLLFQTLTLLQVVLTLPDLPENNPLHDNTVIAARFFEQIITHIYPESAGAIAKGWNGAPPTTESYMAIVPDQPTQPRKSKKGYVQ